MSRPRALASAGPLPDPEGMPAHSPDGVLEFWFSDAARPHWFVRSEAFDARVRDVLGPLHTQAAAGVAGVTTCSPGVCARSPT